MSNRKAAPTLEDVALLAGVSTATVSRCLNSPQQVSEVTRARVLDAVGRLGYTPNFAARVMAARRSNTIGAIIPTMENAIFARGLQAFQEALVEKGYTLLVSSTAYSPELEAEQIRTLVARGADGLLLIGHDRDARLHDYLARQDVPALIAWSYRAGGPLPSVGFDNRAAMRGLADKVLALGHRRIAMISAETSGNDRARARVAGLRDALEGAGLDPKRLPLIKTPYGIESGASAFAELIAAHPGLSAVICGNDVLAAGALVEARRRGIAVPDELSITGFDDLELAQIVSPALTTVRVPHRQMGRRAADALVRMVEARDRPVSVRLETEIMLRASLGPAPNGP